MVTVLVTFYHPGLGAIRGTVVRGIPMVSLGDLAAILRLPTEGGHGRTAWATVPAMADEWGEADAKALPLVPEDAAVRLVEGSAGAGRERLLYWLADFLFPALRQLYGTRKVLECDRAFYWECQDPAGTGGVDISPAEAGKDDTKPRKGR